MQTKKLNEQTNQKTILEQQGFEANNGFKINLTAYATVNILLIIINMLTTPNFPWFLFPLCGWGFGLTMHYIFGVRLQGK